MKFQQVKIILATGGLFSIIACGSDANNKNNIAAPANTSGTTSVKKEVIEAWDAIKDKTSSSLSSALAYADNKLTQWKDKVTAASSTAYQTARQKYDIAKEDLKAYEKAGEPDREAAKEKLKNSWSEFRKAYNNFADSFDK